LAILAAGEMSARISRYHPPMRWYSTRESVRAGEPTVMAIVETLLAMGASVAIGVWTGSWWHLTAGAALIPLVLLRTESGTAVGWRLARRLAGQGTALTNSLLRRGLVVMGIAALCGAAWGLGALLPDSTPAPLFYLAVLLAAVPTWFAYVGLSAIVQMTLSGVIIPLVAGRVVGGIAGVYLEPRAVPAAVCSNWWKSVLCIDHREPMEALPKPDRIGESPTEVHIFDLATDSHEAFDFLRFNLTDPDLRGTSIGSLPIKLALLVFLLPIFAVSIAVRYSIKSATLLWAPLALAMMPPKPENEPWTAHLRLFGRGDLTKIVGIISIFTLAVFVGKYILFAANHALATQAASWESGLGKGLAEFVVPFFRPGVFPIWQFAAVLNAILFLIAAGLARHWLLRHEAGLAINEVLIGRTLAWLLGVRRILTSYVIVCNFWAAWWLARKLPLPPVGSELFPWL
jgi:hypothetical protein